MINFQAIEVQNFNSIGHIERFEFSPGIHSVQGLNLDEERSKSNGSGKSSFFDAIVWCLYGKTPNGKTADAVVNRSVGGNCVVKLWFVIGENQYRIERYRKHDHEGKNIKVFINEQDETIHPPSQNQDTIDNIIQIPFGLFTSSFIIAQGLENRFTALTDFQRKETIENVRNTKVWDKSRELAKAEKKKIEEEISEVELTVARKDELAKSHQEGLQELKQGIRNLMEQKENLSSDQDQKDLERKLTQLREEKSKLAEIVESQDQERKDLDEAITKTYQCLNEIPDEISTLQEQNSEYEEITKLQDYIDEKNEILRRAEELAEKLNIKESRERIEKLQNLVKKAKEDKEEADNAHTQAYNHWKELEAQVNSLQEKVNSSQKLIEFYEHSLDPDHDPEECPTCGEVPEGKQLKRKYQEELDKMAELRLFLEEKTTELNRYEHTVGEAEQKAMDARKNLLELEEEYSEERESLRSLDEKVNKVEGEAVGIDRKISSIQNSLEEAGFNFNQIPEIEEKITGNTEKITKLREKRENLQEKSQKLTQKKTQIVGGLDENTKKLDLLSDKISQLKEKSEEFSRKIEEIQTQIRIKEESLSNITEKRHQIVSEKEAAEKNRKKLEKELPVYENLDKIFSPKGIRAHIISKDIGFLNQRLDFYSKHFFSDMYIQLDPGVDEEGNVSKINIPVHTTMNFQKTYEDCSGGERRRIDICVQLAIFDLILSISSITTNLLVLDEVFEGLDSEGVKAVMDVVRSIADNGASIYVISHLPNLGEHVEDTVMFVKQNGVTQLDNEMKFAA